MDFLISPNPTQGSLAQGLILGHKKAADQFCEEALFILTKPEMLKLRWGEFNRFRLTTMADKQLAEYGITKFSFTDDTISARQWISARDSYLQSLVEYESASVER